jgi:hypothetical protein
MIRRQGLPSYLRRIYLPPFAFSLLGAILSSDAINQHALSVGNAAIQPSRSQQTMPSLLPIEVDHAFLQSNQPIDEGHQSARTKRFAGE